jgi:hypothetical protein
VVANLDELRGAGFLDSCRAHFADRESKLARSQLLAEVGKLFSPPDIIEQVAVPHVSE